MGVRIGRIFVGTVAALPGLATVRHHQGRAIGAADVLLGRVLAKARYWQRLHGVPINERQKRILNLLLDGFEGKLTTSKYAKLAKCSQDTALRDVNALVKAGALIQNPAGGRSTSYRLVHDGDPA